HLKQLKNPISILIQNSFKIPTSFPSAGIFRLPDRLRRAVTEHQLLHDKARAVQGLKRLMWLQHALGAVHTASSRDVPLPNASESQDPSDFNSSDGDEASSLMKQLTKGNSKMKILKELQQGPSLLLPGPSSIPSICLVCLRDAAASWGSWSSHEQQVWVINLSLICTFTA
uniref:Uncharacterized protein n=1 Tax=Taeniopygia guttata TaxID=59729 RepID=A0A674GFI4_TAEGU